MGDGRHAGEPVLELFADGVLDVGFGNGMVRIDLFSLSARARDAAGQPLPEIRQRVVMSLPGFLSSLATLEGMRDRLEAAGLVQANPPGAGGPVPPTAESPTAESPTAESPVSGPRSPNFR